ncbi:MAG: phospholipase D-like domain-containing protein, partial [Candidatus Sericytochromatia bacterium]
MRRLLLTTLIASSLLTGCGQAPALTPAAGATSQSVQASARGLLTSTGNRVELLVDAGPIFDSMVRSINQAKQSVQLHAFQLGGNVGMRLVEALIERHRAGVQVQVLVDPAHGGAGSGKEMMLACLAALEEAGVPTRDFRLAGMPKGPNWIARLGRIDHSKILV